MIFWGNKKHRHSYLLVLLFLSNACKKSYEAIPEESANQIRHDVDYRAEFTGSSRNRVHEKSTGEDTAEFNVEMRPEIIPVDTNLASNLERGLNNYIPQGPDCHSPAQAKSVDCPKGIENKQKAISEFLEFFFPIAWAAQESTTASNEKPRYLPDRSFTQKQLLKWAPPHSEILPHFKQLANVHIFSKSTGTVFNQFDFVLTFANGREFWGRGDSDTASSCRLIEKALPTNGKDFFEVVEIGKGTKSKFRHPFNGKACKTQTLEGYRVLNLRVFETAKKTDTPSLVLLIAKASKQGSSYFINRRSAGSSEFYPQLLAAFNTKSELKK